MPEKQSKWTREKRLKRTQAGRPCECFANQKRDLPDWALPRAKMIRPQKRQPPAGFEWTNQHEYFDFAVNACWRTIKSILAALIIKCGNKMSW